MTALVYGGGVKREVKDELLDTLPHDHPEALVNRRDLQRLNALMGSHRWLARTLERHHRSGDRVLEIGAGRGEFARRLHGRNGNSSTIHLDGLDLCPEPTHWAAPARWWQHDALSFERYADYQIVVSNLLLHQFEDEELASLGKRLMASARLILVCEPARRRLHLAQLKLLGLLGLGRVTLHDGEISIRAGFLGDELPRLLGLDESRWHWSCKTGLRGQYFMVAKRTEDGGLGESWQ